MPSKITIVDVSPLSGSTESAQETLRSSEHARQLFRLSTPESASIPYVGKADDQTRANVRDILAAQTGIRLRKTRVPENESLLDIGEEAKQQMENDVDALPTAKVAFPLMLEAIRAEKHFDVKVPMSRVRMSAENGGIFGEGNAKAPLAYTPRAFSQLAEFYKPSTVRNGFAANLLALPPSLRSEVFNYHANNTHRDESAILRTYVAGERRTMRAIVTERHSQENGDDAMLIENLKGSLPDGGKVRYTRGEGGDLSSIEVIFPMMKRQLKVGDLAMAGLIFRNSEVKAGTLDCEASVLQVLCYNFTTAWAIDDNAESVSLRHVGDLSRRLPRIIAAALKRIDPFVKAFGDAYANPFPAFAPTRGEVLARIAKTFELPESTLDLAAQVWNTHASLTDNAQRDTLAGLANALTCAAKTQTMSMASVTSGVAGQLVAQGWAALA